MTGGADENCRLYRHCFIIPNKATKEDRIMNARHPVLKGLMLGLLGSIILDGGSEGTVQPMIDVTDNDTSQYGNGNSGDNNSDNENWVHPALAKFNEDVEVYEDGDWIVIQTNGVPDHGSPYFST